jgi:hypothetical protein
MAFPNNFTAIRNLMTEIGKLEREFDYCQLVKDYKYKKEIENKLGWCYRKLMHSVKKEKLERIWIENNLLHIILRK